jgi:hypothetical protein
VDPIGSDLDELLSVFGDITDEAPRHDSKPDRGMNWPSGSPSRMMTRKPNTFSQRTYSVFHVGGFRPAWIQQSSRKDKLGACRECQAVKSLNGWSHPAPLGPSDGLCGCDLDRYGPSSAGLTHVHCHYSGSASRLPFWRFPYCMVPVIVWDFRSANLGAEEPPRNCRTCEKQMGLALPAKRHANWALQGNRNHGRHEWLRL